MKKGDSFQQTFVVSESCWRGFIEVFCDRNPLHVDAGYARGRGFKGAVMHGNILNGFLSYFVGECLPFKNVILHSQSIKYLKPVYLNDPLRFFAEVSAVSEAVGVFEFDFHFERGEGEKVAKGKIQIGELR